MTHVEELFPKLEVSGRFTVFVQWEIRFFFFFTPFLVFSLAGEGFYLIMFLGAVMLNWVSFQRSSHL